jgi:uncharacterized membrane protein YuzA (DUF378 family)
MMNSNCNNRWGGCFFSKAAKVLLIVGGINWGLIGAGMLSGGETLNLVNMLVGSTPELEAVVYVLVGIAGVASLLGCKCKKCMAACASFE